MRLGVGLAPQANSPDGTLILAASASAASRPTPLYVSLGDSWSQGFQPLGRGHKDIPTNHGIAEFLTGFARHVFPRLKVVKLGCGGATTTSMINGGKRCVERLPYTSRSPATSQLTYAARFLRRHRGQLKLVTVVIGGNDFASCVKQPTLTAALACAFNGINLIKQNLPIIAQRIRAAAGPRVPIIGMTYADIGLGQWVRPGGQPLATASVVLFKQLLNPTLKAAYASAGIAFVDTTAGFGGYLPLTQTTHLRPYGRIPVAVANICRLGWYCARHSQGDIHLKPAGYRKVARLLYSKFLAIRPHH